MKINAKTQMVVYIHIGNLKKTKLIIKKIGVL